jgi:hypothetical protein
MAIKGLGRVLARPPYLAIALVVTVLFVFVLNMIATGNTYLQLLLSLPILDKFSVIGQVMVNFVENFFALERILMLLLSIAQGVLVASIVFTVRRKRKLDETSILEGGVATLLALLGAGCPLCGGSLIVILLAMAIGTSAYLLLQTVSTIVVVLAFVPVIFALRRQGSLAYTLVNAERAKHDAA